MLCTPAPGRKDGALTREHTRVCGALAEQSSPPKPTDVSVFVNFPKEALGNVPEHAALVGQSIRTAASLTDTPTNELYTDAYVEVARATAERLGCEIRVRAVMAPVCAPKAAR